MNSETLKRAKNALSQIEGDNPFIDCNATMGMVSEVELVFVSQLPDGKLQIREFCRTIGGTLLGNQARQKLQEAGLVVEK